MAHPALFASCAFLMLMLILSWVGYRLVYKPGKFLRQLGRPVITTDSARVIDALGEPEPSTPVTFLNGVASRGPSSASQLATLKADLVRAGFSSTDSLPVF